RQGNCERSGVAGPEPEFRWFFRKWGISRQYCGDEPLRVGVHVVGVEPWPWTVWSADRQGARVCDGEYVAIGFHCGGGFIDARTNVFAWVRDVVSGRSIWDDAPAGDQGKATEGSAADHRLAEH